MSATTLGDLPLEILRRICTYLPSEAALHFLHTCHQVHQACDDWTVWREIVKRNPHFRSESPRLCADSQHAWKSYVIADARAQRCGDSICSRSAVTQYLPHLIALGYTGELDADPEWLYRESKALVSREEYPSSLIRRKDEGGDWWELFTDPESRFDTKEWRFAHAASFCFGACALSETSYLSEPDDPYARLEDVQWFKSSSANETCERQVLMHHALANAAVGCFRLELRSALASEATIGEDFEGTACPPSADSIPLRSHMVPPAPFSPRGLEALTTCHLAATTTPAFFTDSDWTGYFSSRGDWRSVLHGIGGGNQYVAQNLHLSGSAAQPSTVDPVVKFRLAETLEGGDFVMQSNCFHTLAGLHMLNVLVRRKTGHLSMTVSVPVDPAALPTTNAVSNAVVTPFGIVYGIEPGRWLWLWKTAWSGDGCAEDEADLAN